MTLVKVYKKYQKFILYSMIGFSGVFLDLVVFFILFNLYNLDKNLATLISTSIGIINNFTLNLFFNFRTFDRIWLRFISFCLVGVSGIILTLLIFNIFVDQFNFNTNLVKISSVFLVVIWQFNLNKFISFKK